MIITTTFRRALALGAAGVLSFTACGSDDGHTSSVATVAPSADAIVIEIDGDATSPGTQTVPLNSTVSLRITSAEEHEFHLHGYDLEDEGADITMTFVADTAGEFDVEIHGDEVVVFTLVVEG